MRARKPPALLTGLLMLQAPIAHAGAWTLPEQDGLAIFTTSYKIAPVGALAEGFPSQEDVTTQIFLEYGLFDDLTLGFKAHGEVSLIDSNTEIRGGPHVRYRVWQGDGRVVSVQAGAEFGFEGIAGLVTPEDSVTEFDLRVLYGQGWQTSWMNSFVSSELGYRLRAGGAEDEIRMDTTAGIEPFKGVLGLLTVSATVPLGDVGDPSLDVTPSLAYTLWPSLGANDKKPHGRIYPATIQFGVGMDLLDPDDGIRFSLSIWRRF